MNKTKFTVHYTAVDKMQWQYSVQETGSAIADTVLQ